MELGNSGVSKKLGMALAQTQGAQLRDRLVGRPQVDGGTGTAEEPGQIGVGLDAQFLLEDSLGKGHVRSLDLFTLCRQALYAAANVSSRPMDTLAKMIERAMAERGMDAPAVAKASGLTKQSVYNVLNGTTKWDKIRAVTLFALARALGASDAIALYTANAKELPGTSHSLGIDADILVEAEKWVAIEESVKGAQYPPEQRMRRIAVVYERAAADGGRLSRQHQAEFIREAQQAQVQGAGDGHSEKATSSRKAVSKR